MKKGIIMFLHAYILKIKYMLIVIKIIIAISKYCVNNVKFSLIKEVLFIDIYFSN